MNRAEKLQGIVLISKPTLRRLDEKHLIRYRKHREPYIKWLIQEGKHPKKLEGYAHDTAYSYYRL
jgi:hypothetical protein